MKNWKFVASFVLLAAAYCLALWGLNLVPAGHNGLLLFGLKKVFFENYVLNGELPYWLPFSHHGEPARWAYFLQGGAIDGPLMLLARGLGARDFLPWFYLSNFFEISLWFAGLWLFSAHFLENKKVRFLFTLYIGTLGIEHLQRLAGFQFYYSIPLGLFLLREFLKKESLAIWAGFLSLLYVQSSGNSPTSIWGVQLVYFCYFLVTLRMESPKKGITWVALIVGAASSWMAGRIYSHAFPNFESHEFLKESMYRNDFRAFLSAGLGRDLNSLRAVFTGVPDLLGISTYVGAYFIFLFFWSIQRNFKRGTDMLLLAAALMAIAVAMPPISLIAYIWTDLKFFTRSGALFSVALIALALFTFQVFEEKPNEQKMEVRKLAKFGGTFLFLSAAAILWYETSFWNERDVALSMIKVSASELSLDRLKPRILLFYFGTFGAFALRELVVLLFCGAGLWLSRVTSKKTVPILFVALLGDAISYRLAADFFSLNQWSVLKEERLKFSTLDFNMRRVEPARINERESVKEGERDVVGAVYSLGQNFQRQDPAVPMARSLNWTTRSRYLFERMPQYLDKRDFLEVFSRISEKIEEERILRITGVSVAKIVGSEKLVLCKSVDEAISRVSYHPEETAPVIESDEVVSVPRGAFVPCGSEDVTAPEIDLGVKDIAFYPNRLSFRIYNPREVSIGGYLSQSWDEKWALKINGKAAKLYPANIKFSAFVVPPGESRVELRYYDPLMRWDFCLRNLVILAWALFGIYQGARIFYRKRNPQTGAMR